MSGFCFLLLPQFRMVPHGAKFGPSAGSLGVCAAERADLLRYVNADMCYFCYACDMSMRLKACLQVPACTFGGSKSVGPQRAGQVDVFNGVLPKSCLPTRRNYSWNTCTVPGTSEKALESGLQEGDLIVVSRQCDGIPHAAGTGLLAPPAMYAVLPDIGSLPPSARISRKRAQ